MGVKIDLCLFPKVCRSTMRAILAFCMTSIAMSHSLCSLAAQERFYRPQVGEFHVDFTLPKIRDRQPVSLSDFKGKKVLLLHFASW